MRIKIQLLHEDAREPKQGREGDAGWDLVATSKTIEDKYVEYGTGIAVAIPEDHVGLLFPRSSVSNYDLNLANCVGVIDPNYRGEIKLRFKPQAPFFSTWWINAILPRAICGSGDFRKYEVGDKVGQLIVMPRSYIEFDVVDDLDKTNRGAGGFGSSGK